MSKQSYEDFEIVLVLPDAKKMEEKRSKISKRFLEKLPKSIGRELAAHTDRFFAQRIRLTNQIHDHAVKRLCKKFQDPTLDKQEAVAKMQVRVVKKLSELSAPHLEKLGLSYFESLLRYPEYNAEISYCYADIFPFARSDRGDVRESLQALPIKTHDNPFCQYISIKHLENLPSSSELLIKAAKSMGVKDFLVGYLLLLMYHTSKEGSHAKIEEVKKIVKNHDSKSYKLIDKLTVMLEKDLEGPLAVKYIDTFESGMLFPLSNIIHMLLQEKDAPHLFKEENNSPEGRDTYFTKWPLPEDHDEFNKTRPKNTLEQRLAKIPFGVVVERLAESMLSETKNQRWRRRIRFEKFSAELANRIVREKLIPLSNKCIFEHKIKTIDGFDAMLDMLEESFKFALLQTLFKRYSGSKITKKKDFADRLSKIMVSSFDAAVYVYKCKMFAEIRSVKIAEKYSNDLPVVIGKEMAGHVKVLGEKRVELIEEVMAEDCRRLFDKFSDPGFEIEKAQQQLSDKVEKLTTPFRGQYSVAMAILKLNHPKLIHEIMACDAELFSENDDLYECPLLPIEAEHVVKVVESMGAHQFITQALLLLMCAAAKPGSSYEVRADERVMKDPNSQTYKAVVKLAKEFEGIMETMTAEGFLDFLKKAHEVLYEALDKEVVCDKEGKGKEEEPPEVFEEENKGKEEEVVDDLGQVTIKHNRYFIHWHDHKEAGEEDSLHPGMSQS